MIEGEEEIGSPNLGKWCGTAQGNAESRYYPSIRYHHDYPRHAISDHGLRGLAYWQVKLPARTRICTPDCLAER